MAASSKKPFDVSHHFEELSKFYGQEDYDKALRSVNAILKELPDDQKAIQCRVTCLVQLSRFGEATDEAGFVQDQDAIRLPLAYSFYRLGRFSDVLNCLDASKNDLTIDLKELKAQTLYKLERYDECLELYRELLKKQRDDMDSERQANFLAVLTQLQLNGSRNVPSFTPSAYETYELAFNSAALELARHNYAEAEKKLRKAEQLFEDMANEEGYSKEKKQKELSNLKVQLVNAQLQSARKQTVEKPAGFSAESIENNFLNQFSKLKKKPKKDNVAGDGGPASPRALHKDAVKVEPLVIQKKKHRKKKKRLPKNYDPNIKPDPERWLPKVERSTYKKKKDKRSNVGKGTQGSTLPVDVSSGPNTPKGRHVEQPAGPRQQKPQAAAKKQAKKKKK